MMSLRFTSLIRPFCVFSLSASVCFGSQTHRASEDLERAYRTSDETARLKTGDAFEFAAPNGVLTDFVDIRNVGVGRLVRPVLQNAGDEKACGISLNPGESFRVWPISECGFIAFHGRPKTSNPAFRPDGTNAFVYVVSSGKYPIVSAEYAARRKDGSLVALELSTDGGKTFCPLDSPVSDVVRNRTGCLVRVKSPIDEVVDFLAETEVRFAVQEFISRIRPGRNAYSFKADSDGEARVIVSARIPVKRIPISGKVAYDETIKGQGRAFTAFDSSQGCELKLSGLAPTATARSFGNVRATISDGTLTLKARDAATVGSGAVIVEDAGAEKEIVALTGPGVRFSAGINVLRGQDYNSWRIAARSAASMTFRIQARIDALAAKGGGTLRVGPGTYRVGSLHFRPGVNLHLEEGATILGSDDGADYSGALINASGCDGFRISGKGVIDGHGLPTWRRFWEITRENMKRGKKEVYANVSGSLSLPSPNLFFASKSRNLDISGVTFRNSKGWTTHYRHCEDVFIHDCTIEAQILDGVPGPCTDAIDLWAVRHAVISNVIMAVNDDAVTLKGGIGLEADDLKKFPQNGPNSDILITHCTFKYPVHQCLAFGSECVWGENVTMRDCRVDGVKHAVLNLKLRPDTPQWFSNVLIERISGTVGDAVMFAKPWTQANRVPKGGRGRKSFVDGVTLRDLDLTCDSFLSAVRSPDYELKSFDFSNLRIHCRKNADWDQAVFDNLKASNVHLTKEAK